MHTKFLICRVTLYYLGVAKIVRENPHDASGQQFSEMCQRQKKTKAPRVVDKSDTAALKIPQKSPLFFIVTK